MSEQCIAVGSEFLAAKYIAEDETPRDGGRWPEYASTMVICVDSYENGLASGRLHNFCFREPDSFASLDQLVFALEGVLERAQLLQSELDTRSVIPPKKRRGRKRKHPLVQEEPPLERRTTAYPLDAMRPMRGKLASFYVRVFARQHASIQGVLVRADCEERYAFRSGLELMHYLRDLLEAQQPTGK